jgi:hypothetical protein
VTPEPYFKGQDIAIKKTDRVEKLRLQTFFSNEGANSDAVKTVPSHSILKFWETFLQEVPVFVQRKQTNCSAENLQFHPVNVVDKVKEKI